MRGRGAGETVRLDRVVWRAVTGWDLAARRAGGGVQLDWAAGPVSVHGVNNSSKGKANCAAPKCPGNALPAAVR